MKSRNIHRFLIAFAALAASSCTSTDGQEPAPSPELEVDGPSAQNAAKAPSNDMMSNNSAPTNGATNVPGDGGNTPANGEPLAGNSGNAPVNGMENPVNAEGLDSTENLPPNNLSNGNPANLPSNNPALGNGEGLNNGEMSAGSLNGNGAMFDPDVKTTPAPNSTASSPLSLGPGNTTLTEAPPANAGVVPPPTDALPSNSANSGITPVDPPADAATVAPQNQRPTFKVLSDEEKTFWLQAASKLKNLAPGEGPSEYIVQPGDTLWDVCDQLLDDYNWWPKLWTLNPQIQNPHLIYPGQKLVFGSSDGTTAPSLAVTDLGKANPIPAGSPVITQVETPDNHPWIGHENELLDASEIPADTFFDVVGSKEGPSSILVQNPGFLASSPPAFSGEIVRAGEGFSIARHGTTMYAELSDGASAGQRYLAIREAERPMNPAGNDDGNTTLFLFSGVVGVVKKHQSGLTSLVVEETRHGVRVGDRLIPFRSIYQSVDPRSVGRPAGVKAEVLAAGEELSELGSTGSVLILEKHEGNAGPGDDIELFMPPGGITSFQSDGLDALPVARARVLDSTSESLSAVIISNSREVSVGAKTWPSDF